MDWHAGHLYHCEWCNKIFYSKFAFTLHVQEHTKTRYQCSQCVKSHTLRSLLYNHCKTDTSKLYKCIHPGCNYSVKSECQYREHYTYFHRGKKQFCARNARNYSRYHHIFTPTSRVITSRVVLCLQWLLFTVHFCFTCFTDTVRN